MVLRPWRESDAEALYEYAKDERVGPVAGWPAHCSVDESREIIRTVFAQEGVFALTLKGSDKAIGCIGVIRGARSNFPIGEDEGEVSYWLGVPFWGTGTDARSHVRGNPPRLRGFETQKLMVRILRWQRKIEAGAGEVRIPTPSHRRKDILSPDRRLPDRARQPSDL